MSSKDVETGGDRPKKSQAARFEAAADTASINLAIFTLLGGIDRVGDGSPGALAFRSALRRKGEELAALGGSDALRRAVEHLQLDAPEQAERWGGIIAEVWAGLPEWTARPGAAA